MNILEYPRYILEVVSRPEIKIKDGPWLYRNFVLNKFSPMGAHVSIQVFSRDGHFCSPGPGEDACL